MVFKTVGEGVKGDASGWGEKRGEEIFCGGVKSWAKGEERLGSLCSDCSTSGFEGPYEEGPHE